MLISIFKNSFKTHFHLRPFFSPPGLTRQRRGSRHAAFPVALRWLLGVVLLLILGGTAHAQVGTLRGSILDDATEKPLQGATIVVDFSGQKATTNVYGDFIIGGIPVGNITITIYYPKYKTRRVDGLRIAAGRTTVVNLHLREELSKLNDAVDSKRFQETEVAVITEIKNSENIATGISAEELLRTQDVDAAQSLKRLSGVLVNEERFVTIRGLNERYNTVMINDVPAPSVEVDSRAFSFDVVPTPLLDRIMVYKGGSAELPGDYAGGVVKIHTKDIPDSSRWYFNIATAYRQQTTTRAITRGMGGASDVFGYDDGGRNFIAALPSRLKPLDVVNGRFRYSLDREENIQPIGLWNTETWRSLPDFRFNLGYTGKFQLGNALLGTLTLVDYQNNNQALEVSRQRYINRENQRADTAYYQRDNAYTSEVKIGGIHNMALAINNRNKVEWKNLFNLVATDNTNIRRELDFRGNKVPIREWDAYNFQYERRMIYSTQLAGQHYISSSTQFKWTGGYGTTYRDEPNTRRFRHSRLPYTYGAGRVDYFGRLSGAGDVPLPLYRDASHFYSQLHENVITGTAQLDQVLNPFAEEDKQLKLSAGLFVEQKSRDFNARLFGYQPTTYRDSLGRYYYNPGTDTLAFPEPFRGSINDRNGLVFNEFTRGTDSYTAANTNVSGFASLLWPITSRLSLKAGIRVESNTQSITSDSGRVKVNNPAISPLPSAHLTYSFNDQSMLRVAYNASVIRPALGELAPFVGYDFATDMFRMGNPNLQTTSVQNLDVRLELYPSRYDLVTIGAFAKTFDKPIELVMDTVGYGTSMRFVNSRSAFQYGVDLEVRRSLKELVEDPFFKCISLSGNVTFTQSVVQVGNELEALGLDNNRPLLGHSPYTVNFGIYYINPKQRAQVNLTYNVFGPRVWAVGNAIHPTIYEMSRHLVNLNMSKEIGKHFEARLTIQDLLNMPYRFVQDDSRNGTPDYNTSIISNYRRGTLATVGFTYKL